MPEIEEEFAKLSFKSGIYSLRNTSLLGPKWMLKNSIALNFRQASKQVYFETPYKNRPTWTYYLEVATHCFVYKRLIMATYFKISV
ncbi:hypothetical protein AVEN_189293-1 [Araneus ventricosus]|uniref:Uncharacterized protein n=1 Tax=Araneus ventricosus TaxID=182803 RepID=A0A4Y2PBJ7_ARAVE|nr:hypothetical protein AVEN_189293-1 [Araneus ventricosus]